MKENVVILIIEHDEGHFTLIRENLLRSGIHSEIIRFADGQQTLDFLFRKGAGPHRQHKKRYLLLLDIHGHKVDGVEVLGQIKKDPELKKIPVLIMTSADDPAAIERCHDLGCSIYMVKPLANEDFVDTVRKVGLFLSAVEIPQINGTEQALR